MEHARERTLTAVGEILVASPPYLVATKLDAYLERGASDVRLSQDLEDVIILFDGRPELGEEIAAAPRSVRTWIEERIRDLLSSAAFLESISGHLPPDPASQARSGEVVRRMRVVAEG